MLPAQIGDVAQTARSGSFPPAPPLIEQRTKLQLVR